MIGIDFGTTNSAVARLTADGPQLAEFSLLGEITNSFRSVLYFSIEERVSARVPGVFSGPQAIEQYLEEDAAGRYVQSLKSLLPSRTFESTQVLGTVYTLEDMIAEILRGLRVASHSSLGELGSKAVVGRPVHFVGARQASDEEHALGRLRDAFDRAGFDDITFALEPVAAAAGYASTLTKDETLLVADFGGGTSDFCVLQVGPNAAKMPQHERVLATDGVGLAGERFDARIVRERIAPRLGRGTQYKALGGALFDIPDWLYVKLSDWHELSFLRAERPLKVLRDVASGAVEQKAVRAFQALVEHNMGYFLYDQVEASKRRLSGERATQLRFDDAGVSIDEHIERADFEAWIADDLDQIVLALDRCLGAAGKRPEGIDRVFLTGGTAFVPAVREIFEDTFGEAKLSGGGELTSVATGLARLAATAHG